MTIRTIDASTLKQWMEQDKVILIDVREPWEYQEHNIPGSFLQPLGGVSLDTIPEAKDKKLVIHCKGGKRSMDACEKLVTQNSKLEVYNLEGGILSWIEKGFAVK